MTGEQAGTDPDVDRRLGVLELILLRLHLVVCGALLVAGTLVPFAYEVDDEAEQSFNLVTVFADFDGESEAVAFMIGFAGLLVCTAAAAVIVMLQWSARLSPIALRIGKVVGALMVIGAIVPTVASLNSVEIPRAEPGFGMAFYYAGAVAFLYLMFSRTVGQLRAD